MTIRERYHPGGDKHASMKLDAIYDRVQADLDAQNIVRSEAVGYIEESFDNGVPHVDEFLMLFGYTGIEEVEALYYEELEKFQLELPIGGVEDERNQIRGSS